MSYILDINNAIAQSVATVKANAKKNGWTMREPDYVAALTTEFPKRIAGLIPGVRYGGCFIHQRPLITFTSTIDGNQHRCELGDLLIICRKTVDGKERYNAALLQFKKANSKCLTIYKPSELRQLEASPRLRQAYDLRNSEKDNSQRMLNAPEPEAEATSLW